jgi:hypothetical protein
MPDDSVFATVKLHKKTIHRLHKVQNAMAAPPMRPPTLSGVIEMALDALLSRGK